MPRRFEDVAMLNCPCTARERAAVDEMKSMLGLSSDANVLRAALAHYARWLEPNTDPALFEVRRGSDFDALRRNHRRIVEARKSA